MRIHILVASANLGNGRTGGLHEEHDVAKDRAEYLVSIGAAEEVKDPAKAETKKAEAPKETETKKPAPARRPAPRTK